MYQNFDVAIAGTGMGGATLGHALTKIGLRIIFIEKGPIDIIPHKDGGDSNRDQESRPTQGQWPDPITFHINGIENTQLLPLGCAIGGSTLFYNATLERFAPLDFEATETTPAWPVSYNEMVPFYKKAEELFRVPDADDTLALDGKNASGEPLRLTSCDQNFFSSFRSSGLHPHRLRSAIRWSKKGRELANARNTCVEPALNSGKATVLDRCTVLRVATDDDKITHLECERDGQPIKIKARAFVLACGALNTPALLLRSASPSWPNGLGNQNDLVGRNLMFHHSDFYAVWPNGPARSDTVSHSLCIRDFYTEGKTKLGVVQSTGLQANSDLITEGARRAIEESPLKRAPYISKFIRFPASFAYRLLGRGAVLATIVEDMPYHDNRVFLSDKDPNSFQFSYTIRDELRHRTRRLRKLIRTTLKKHWHIRFSSDINLNYPHACGTCRFGDDPSQSVLDRNNKVHGTENLYVVDASFFPTSAAINPSLTIAANALRVAQHLSTSLTRRATADIAAAMS
jgi:choline dehydrogenase-like flavoprotein